MKYLEHNTARDIRRAGDGCLCGCLLALIVIVAAVMFLNVGCATCPPCQPTIEIQEVQVPVYSCPDPPELEVLHLLQYPPYPESLATDQELKDWFSEVVRIVRSRDSILSSYVDYLLALLNEYRTPPE